MAQPLDTAVDGRDVHGRFAPGNRAGQGNPFAKRVAELRSAFYEAVSREDLAAVVRALVEKARAGDVPAAREVLERLLGKAEAIDVLARVEELEQRLAEVAESGTRRWT